MTLLALRPRGLIVGAIGCTGRQLVVQALERGYAVTAFVLDPLEADAYLAAAPGVCR